MHRIDSTTAQANKFGTGKNGFTEGDPVGGTPATQLTGAMFDALQEERCNFLEDFGIALNKADNTQVRQLVRAMQRAMGSNFTSALASGTSETLVALASDAASDQPRWVAGSVDGHILTSRGGTLWTTTFAASGAPAVVGIVWNSRANTWVAVLDNGHYAVSADGIAWTDEGLVIASPDAPKALCATALGSAYGVYVAGSTTGAGVIYGTDSGGGTRVAIVGTSALRGICSGAILVAVGDSGAVVTSPDGVAWTAGAGVGAGVSLRAVAYSQRSALYVAVGLAGALFTSPDGLAWTDRSIAGGPDFTSIAADPYGGFVAVGGARAFSSDNGLSWTERAVASANTLEAVAFAKGAWMAAGDLGTLLAGPRF